MNFQGPQVDFLNHDVFLTMKAVSTLANSANPNEMQHYVSFHLGLHCLPKYPFRGFQKNKGLRYEEAQDCMLRG